MTSEDKNIKCVFQQLVKQQPKMRIFIATYQLESPATYSHCHVGEASPHAMFTWSCRPLLYHFQLPYVTVRGPVSSLALTLHYTSGAGVSCLPLRYHSHSPYHTRGSCLALWLHDPFHDRFRSVILVEQNRIVSQDHSTLWPFRLSPEHGARAVRFRIAHKT
jgi:hypothetical protein